MGTERKGRGEGEIHEILERVKPLRRILQPTEEEETALNTLQGAVKDRSLTKQARARLAALKIVRQSFNDYVAASGDFSLDLDRSTLSALKPGEGVPVPPELSERLKLALHMGRGLEMLEEWMATNLKEAEGLETDLSREGVTLDPIRPAWSTVRTGRKGSPPSFLAETVKVLLRERCPEWDDAHPLPEGNTRELRVWLNSRLMAFVGSQKAGVDSGAVLFDIEDIHPRRKGPLWGIINTLKNPDRH